MVTPEEFRAKIRELISQDYRIVFLGKNFDKIVGFLPETKAGRIYDWLSKVLKREIQPILIGSKKPYKNWRVNELMTFRHAFQINNTAYRILLVKVKNLFYIEFHLGDHNYYDKVRKDLELRR